MLFDLEIKGLTFDERGEFVGVVFAEREFLGEVCEFRFSSEGHLDIFLFEVGDPGSEFFEGWDFSGLFFALEEHGLEHLLFGFCEGFGKVFEVVFGFMAFSQELRLDLTSGPLHNKY